MAYDIAHMGIKYIHTYIHRKHGCRGTLEHVEFLNKFLKPLVLTLSICNVHFEFCTVFAMNYCIFAYSDSLNAPIT